MHQMGLCTFIQGIIEFYLYNLLEQSHFIHKSVL